MKHCPLCDKTYADDVSTCPLDGGRLFAQRGGDSLLGQVIKSRYRVLRKLGEGGMGTVYLAEQLSISREVALKVLHRQFASDRVFVQRFHREARLAASLNDPRITTVFDFDQGDDGSLFIVMEYLEGTLLNEIIHRERPMDVQRAVRLGIQIADALGAAHAAGVIHRDIKPQNVMVLTPSDRVKLMDFGIARLGDTQDAAQLTRAGMLMGTPNYMAPEQIEGRPVSAKADIYAFGVVLYEMLAGTTPFSAPTSTAVLAKQLRESPPPLRSVRPDVPALVEQVVMQALEKQPEWRQESMADLARRLRAAGGLPQSEPLRVPAAATSVPAPPRPEHPDGARLTDRGAARSPWKLSTALGLGVVFTAGIVTLGLYASGRESRSSPAPTLASQTPRANRDPIVIRTAVEAKLRGAGLLREHASDELGVTVEGVGPDGIVRLSGVVRNKDDRDAVLRLARSVQGVTGVASRLNVPWTPN